MAIPRHLSATLKQRAASYPVVTLTGPRQSGKTTLCREVFPKLPYVNLEQPDLRALAGTDPKAFLAQFPSGAIIDEVQRLPELLSWVQVQVDARPGAGQFILTGNHQFELMESVTQSLAGRTALLRLLPFSINELRAVGLRSDTPWLLVAGGYPHSWPRGRALADVGRLF